MYEALNLVFQRGLFPTVFHRMEVNACVEMKEVGYRCPGRVVRFEGTHSLLPTMRNPSPVYISISIDLCF